jgi:cytochrome c oxidase cbb3-type subunit III
MSDFAGGFLDIYIAALCLLGMAGCAILLWSQSTHHLPEVDHV